MKVFRVSSDGACLSEMALITLHRLVDASSLIEKKVKTLTGISARRFTKVHLETLVRSKNGYKVERMREVWVDWVTGSLYELDGSCLSSPHLKIVETDQKPYCRVKEMLENFKFGYGGDYEYSSN